MGVYIYSNKLVTKTEQKTVSFDLHEDVDIDLKHKVCSVIKHILFFS